MLRRMLPCLLALLALSVGISTSAETAPPVVYLWPTGHPTLQGADEKEVTVPPDPKPGQRINSIVNVHNPSIEVRLPPADKATGTAVLVAPGGGHRQLVWGSEGTDIAEWLNGWAWPPSS